MAVSLPDALMARLGRTSASARATPRAANYCAGPSARREV